MTLPELRLAAERAGGAPLPFEMAAATTTTPLEDRLGQTRGGTEEASYAAALAALHEPSASLERRGLLVDGRLEPGLAGAIGLLATPDLAVDFDVVVEGVQVKSWQRQSDLGVATLATADGIVFEIVWLPTDRWADELGRVATLPSDLRMSASGVPASVDLPFELLDAAGEALHSGRGDLVPVLADHHSGAVVKSGRPVADADVAGLLQTLSRETRGGCAPSSRTSATAPRASSGWCPGCCSPTAGTPSRPRAEAAPTLPSSGSVPSRRATWRGRWPP